MGEKLKGNENNQQQHKKSAFRQAQGDNSTKNSNA
jgi:hypothetical protein